jgi:hypothetical protein
MPDDPKTRQSVDRYAEQLFAGEPPVDDEDPDREALHDLFSDAPPEKPNRFEK